MKVEKIGTFIKIMFLTVETVAGSLDIFIVLDYNDSSIMMTVI